MSKITIAIRFSDDTISTFKVHKSIQYMTFSNILYLLDEQLLKKYLEENNYLLERSAKTLEAHQDYDEDSAFFAPYDYGITFIDFKNKTVYDYNGYSIFVQSYAVNIRLGLSNVLAYLFREPEKIEIKNLSEDFYLKAPHPRLSKDGYHNELVFQSLNPEKSSLFNVYQAYQNNIPIYYTKGNKKNGFNKVYFEVSNVSDLFSQISEIGDMNVIGFDIPEWNFISGSHRRTKSLLEILKEDIQFSDSELKFWRKPVYTNY